MAVKVPPVTMGELCECGRGGRVPSNMSVCYTCLDDLRTAFWDLYNREHAAAADRQEPAGQAAVQARREADPRKRPGTPGSVRAAVRVTARAGQVLAVKARSA
jgi:hypothetical protein